MLSLKKIIFLQDQEYVFCFCILSDVFFPNVILNTELTFLVGNIKELVDNTDSHSTKQVWRLHNPELLLVLCHVTNNLLPGNIVFLLKLKANKEYEIEPVSRKNEGEWHKIKLRFSKFFPHCSIIFEQIV